MTVTQLPTHPAWCQNHVLDDLGAHAYCESRQIEAGSLAVVLIREGDSTLPSSGEVHADVVQLGGVHLEIPAAEIKSVIGALLWAKSQVAQTDALGPTTVRSKA